MVAITHLRGGSGPSSSSAAAVFNAEELGVMAYDWCVNLGAPAALVAGAVVATLYENVRGGALDVYQDDPAYTVFAKKATNVLLLSAFGLQIISIFVTTVLGTMLVTRDFASFPLKHAATAAMVTTPLAFLREYFEFEYLTARISFLQGLLNWLGAVALEHTIPRRKKQGRAGREMDQFIASSLGTLLVLLLAFYNAHLTFYDNYLHMVWRWCVVFFKRYFQEFRPLAFVYIPLIGLSMFNGIRLMWPEKDGNLQYPQQQQHYGRDSLDSSAAVTSKSKQDGNN
jgi:hypothetical protein